MIVFACVVFAMETPGAKKVNMLEALVAFDLALAISCSFGCVLIFNHQRRRLFARFRFAQPKSPLLQPASCQPAAAETRSQSTNAFFRNTFVCVLCLPICAGIILTSFVGAGKGVSRCLSYGSLAYDYGWSSQPKSHHRSSPDHIFLQRFFRSMRHHRSAGHACRAFLHTAEDLRCS